MAHSLAQARESIRRTRMRLAAEMHEQQHVMLSTTAAAVLGVAEAKGHRLPAMLGLDGTIVAGGALLFASKYAHGDTGRVLQSGASALLAIGAYKLGRSIGGAAIAGTGDGISDSAAVEALLSST
jgi:hypothetical protein